MSSIALDSVRIIQNSILSTVFIDDKIVEPFVEKTDENEKFFNVSKGLFESFRSASKSLDFYQYKPDKDWTTDVDFLFKGRDLLILDWQLIESQDLKQKETLKILKKAIETESLHYVTIYTEAKQISEIFYSIKAFFNSSHTNDNLNICDEIINELDAEGIDTAKITKKCENLFFRLALETGETRDETIKELKGIILGELKDKYKIFSNGLKKISKDIPLACEVFGFYVNKEPFIEALAYPADVQIEFISENFIVINNTIIQITNKNNPEPKDLFTFFTEAVQKVCGNLLSLITLEMRSLLRESSGFIGKDANLISDEILFHQLERKESFFEFLMGIIKSHTVSYFDYKQGRLKSVNTQFWDEYKQYKNITSLLAKMEENDNDVIEEIKKLNVYYNILHIKKTPNSKVSFGDVYYTIDANGKADGRFFLCTTAHCDCLLPEENIKNNFFFVGGEKKNAADLVTKGDDVFCSYINDESGIVAVNWNPRPVILKIADSRVNNNAVIGLDGTEKSYNLVYHSTLKENYTQRMANNSFAHAMRVGIDFASFKKPD